MQQGTRWLAAGAAALFWIAAPQARAQTEPQTPQGLAAQGKPTVTPEGPPRMVLGVNHLGDARVPLLPAPLSLRDFEGMEPRAGLKDKLALVRDFVQQQPNDGKPATQKTEVYLGRTATALYVVFLCFDNHPALVRGHLARRENILKDDYVGVLLDPFQDHRRGVLFQVNPAGVQADAAYTEGNGTDYSYDQVWDSDGRITSRGYMALLAIPFRSLRFPHGGAGWGVVLSRNIPRNSETDNWPHISNNVSGTLPQEATLHGIEGLTGSHNVQINPYVLGQRERTLLNLDPNNPYFSKRNFEGTAGGEIKAVLKDRIVVDATINPDFSQVESDQPQFTVNQRYPVYFPELRPFFLENANYFSTPINLLYTRNIVRPEFGARVTGKVGNTNVGLLLADDREPGQLYAEGDPDYGKHALFGVGRVTQDLGKGSSLGAMFTDYEFAGSSNRVGGLDFTARFNDKWTAQGQTVVSSSHELGSGLPGNVDGGYAAGPASYLEATGNSHNFSFDDNYQDYSTGFQSQVGFISTSDIRENSMHYDYYFYPRHAGTLQRFGLETNQQFAFDHQGNRVLRYSQFDPFVLLSRNTTIAPIAVFNSDTLGPQNGYLLSTNRNFAENQFGAVARSAPWRQVNFNIQAFQGGNVNYNPAPGQPPTELKQQSVQALVTVQPIYSLTVDNTYLLDREHENSTGADAYESQTLRTKINYQFTRAFSARVIVEYDSVLVNPLVTSLVRTKQVSTEALLTWLPHPGTAIYIGYNNDLQNYDRTLCQRANGVCNVSQPILSRSTNYLNDGKQFFIKASYLLRF